MPDSVPSFQCGAPARITERFWLDSTDGPVEHLKIGWLSKHWFTPPAETIQPEPVTSPDRDLAAQPSSRDPALGDARQQRRSVPAEQEARRWRRCACAVASSSIGTGAGRPARPDRATTARRQRTAPLQPAACLGSAPGVVTTG